MSATLIILGVYLILLLYAVGKIFRYVREPAKTLLWFLIVIALPVFGLIFYFFMGRSPRKDKLFQQKSPFYHIQTEPLEKDHLPESKRPLVELLRHNKSAAISFGNRITILQDGEKTFEAIFEAMRNAQSTIHLDYYILEAGLMLDTCIDICKDRVSNGVTVRLIYDGFGSFDLKKKYIRQLTDAGVECRVFFPLRFMSLLKFVNYRNHRKIVIVDQQIAFTGGMNISDKYTSPDAQLGLWRDTFIRIDGPAARHFEQIFRSDWYYAKGKTYSLEKLPVLKHPDGVPVQVIASGPDSDHSGIMQEYFAIITDAADYVYIVTPYFVPGEALMTAFKTSALSGIDVRIMLPYDSDSKWMKWCMFTYFEELLGAGVRIFLYHNGFLHAKVIISDDIVTSIGTANIDDRSFKANFEVNALVYDLQTTETLKQQFTADLDHCEELTLPQFAHRSDRNRLMEPVARLTSAML